MARAFAAFVFPVVTVLGVNAYAFNETLSFRTIANERLPLSFLEWLTPAVPQEGGFRQRR
jgi:hypothetical protein